MKTWTLLAAFMAVNVAVTGDEGAGIPWSEFKALYRESLEREIRKQAIVEEGPQIHSLDQARYMLAIEQDLIRGEVLLSGRIISGLPAPIPLFDTQAVLTEIRSVTGGNVVCSAEGGVGFFPEEQCHEFQVEATFLVRSREEHGSGILSLHIPLAVQNSLHLAIPPEYRLLKATGIPDEEGVYHFPAASALEVKYLDEQGAAAASVIEIDTLSRIRVLKDRFLISTACLPQRPTPGVLALRTPEGAEYIGSSLKASSVRELDGNQYELRIPPGEAQSFSIDFTVPVTPEDSVASFRLPCFQANTGQQGRFIVEEPDDGRVIVAAQGITEDLPAEKLGVALRAEIGGRRTYAKVAINEPITLTIKRFESIPAPPTVLDYLYCLCSFEENGNILSVLSMDLPPDAGSRLTLKSVPEGEIWSLAVNGEAQSMYLADQAQWVIPLKDGETSHVELAFLRKGPKLGLQGRLEVLVPDTGLPAKEIRVGVALPARIELLSMDGPVSSSAGEGWKLPGEPVGIPHFFCQSFYKGEGMTLAIAYKEPVKNNAAGGEK